MDIMICPHCRQRANRPIYLPRAQQIIFDYIWRCPWVTVKEIESATTAQNNGQSENLILVQLSKIRINLKGTPFHLTTRWIKPLHHRYRRKQYRIEEVPNVTF